MLNSPSAEAALSQPAPLELLAPLSREELAIAEALIGHRFSRPEWLALALTHSSATNASGLNNERIEFLGDSILGLVVAEHLVRTNPTAPEGELTRFRSMVVNTHTLAEVMRGMLVFMLDDEYQQAFGSSARGTAGGLEDGVPTLPGPTGTATGGHVGEEGKLLRRVSMRALLRLGRGIPANKELPSRIWANIFEAIVGAIYLDAGLDASRHFVLHMLESTILSVTSPGIETNHKSLLQHVTQKFLGGSVRYLIAGQSGPDHEKVFEIQVKVLDHTFTTARGKSKREAEQAAAALALGALANDWPKYVVNGMARPTELLPYQSVEKETADADEAGELDGEPGYGLRSGGETVSVDLPVRTPETHRRAPLVRLEPRPAPHKHAAPSAAAETADGVSSKAGGGEHKAAGAAKGAGRRKKRRSRRKRTPPV